MMSNIVFTLSFLRVFDSSVMMSNIVFTLSFLSVFSSSILLFLFHKNRHFTLRLLLSWLLSRLQVHDISSKLHNIFTIVNKLTGSITRSV